MDRWEQEIHSAGLDAQEAMRRVKGHLRRICRGWPVVTISFVPFGLLAVVKLHPLVAAVCTAAVLVVAVLVADDILLSRREVRHGRT